MLSAGGKSFLAGVSSEGEQEEPAHSQNCRPCPRERQPSETPASTDAGMLALASTG
jgi:hypothetical protein